ncbi:MAG: helix-turn-helix transcriptional regulator [Oscillospiraceae bacterium]|jgi:transcriptional regulator with XRE-family HTH domain|nr:helix-turn-helix transcriptional regulator [Oscillospiraceae bacterium]
MNATERIRRIMDELKWSEYRLAKESGLSQSTIANLFHRNTVPSISTLESVCGAFGISLAQFFCEGTMVELSGEQKAFFDRWALLSAEQKRLMFELMENMK